MSRARLVAVDLFAGCGGLSLGLAKGGFDVAAAVEIDKNAAITYAANHKKTKLLNKDIRNVTADEIAKAVRRRHIDLIAGCAPCQGFCSLTRKSARQDPRNELVLEMARIIEELLPTAVMMENVPGIETTGGPIYAQFLRRLRRAGYYVQTRVVQMADYGVPQRRRRLVLLAGRGFVIPFPTPSHSRTSDDGRKPWVTVKEAIGSYRRPVRLSEATSKGGPKAHNWHVVRDLQPQTKARLRAAIPGKTWLVVDEAVRPRCHRDGYNGFTNVYQRMSWDQVAVTMTAGCTTPCKGRFGHPDRRRTTISVREAATIQSFPGSYRFATDEMDAVCEMVGNAVPPRFARKIATQAATSLRSHYETLARQS